MRSLLCLTLVEVYILYCLLFAATAIDSPYTRGRKLGEEPYIASPRTAESCKTTEQLEAWGVVQSGLKRKIATRQHLNIVFYGDSITESLMGLSMGKPTCPGRRCSKNFKVSARPGYT